MSYTFRAPIAGGKRVAVLFVALMAGAGAAYMASGASAPAVSVAAPPPIATAEVLVAKVPLQLGATVHAADLEWQAWPASGVSPPMITRETRPKAAEEFEGSVVRSPVQAGEPLRPERFVKDRTGGLMAYMLPPGYRALAISIDTRGTNSAGGFISPNDRVDVIKVTKDDEASRAAGTEIYTSTTLLKNVKVLAIGQNIQEQNGQKVAIGETATLELDPAQVEAVFLAQRTSSLTLSLRSVQDASADATPSPQPAQPGDDLRTINVRYGGNTARRFYCSDESCSDRKQDLGSEHEVTTATVR